MYQHSIGEGGLSIGEGGDEYKLWEVLGNMTSLFNHLYNENGDWSYPNAIRGRLVVNQVFKTRFTLDKESHTLGLVCQDVTLVVAFDTKERLLQWQVKITATLGEELQFLVQVIQVPPRSRVATGPARLHIRDHRFCLASGTPPRLLAAWATSDLRRYGVVDGRVVWDGGSRCGRWAGVHVAISDTPHSVIHALDKASRGHVTKASSGRSRSGSTADGSQIDSRMDATTWMREVSALDLHFDTMSLAGSEATTVATSPRDIFPRPSCECYSSNQQENWSRRTPCQCGTLWDGPASIDGGGGWWAARWARESLGSINDCASDSLYDKPRHTKSCFITHQQLQQQQQHHHLQQNHHHQYQSQQQQQQPQQHQQQLNHQLMQHQHLRFESGSSAGESKIPSILSKSELNILQKQSQEYNTHYDVPRRIAPSINDKGCSPQHTAQDLGVMAGGHGCSKVLGWAGSIVCGPKEDSGVTPKALKVDGHGRMPVVDAYTGTLLRHLPPPPPLPPQNTGNQPLYAVVNKNKYLGKPRAPTPPPSPPVEECLDTKVNYANLKFTESLPLYENVRDLKKSQIINSRSTKSTQVEFSKTDSKSKKLLTPPNECHQLQCRSKVKIQNEGSISAVQTSKMYNSLNMKQDIHNPDCTSCQSKKLDESNGHYLSMTPKTQSSDLHYLSMQPIKSHSSTLIPTQEDVKPCQNQVPLMSGSSTTPRSGLGRSLSLAAHEQTFTGPPRRSTSADSLSRDDWEATPSNTPSATPKRTAKYGLINTVIMNHIAEIMLVTVAVILDMMQQRLWSMRKSFLLSSKILKAPLMSEKVYITQIIEYIITKYMYCFVKLNNS
ncbi:unnamed protein product [Meganyctiphanes norvegica]|uniref:IRS-type PTB domain-containing protein n=1 Tax=Meganyctiphanes norvegica TaxID=48144 RepID=A0AAV2SBG6_MEGNR